MVSSHKQVKRDVERILKGVTLQIMTNSTYTQPRTVAKEHRNPILVTYAQALQVAAENRLEITNKETSHLSKRNCIVLFNALDTKSFPKLPQKKENKNDKQDDQKINSSSNETTTCWREELQETLVETTKLLEKTNTKSKRIRGTIK